MGHCLGLWWLFSMLAVLLGAQGATVLMQGVVGSERATLEGEGCSKPLPEVL